MNYSVHYQFKNPITKVESTVIHRACFAVICNYDPKIYTELHYYFAYENRKKKPTKTEFENYLKALKTIEVFDPYININKCINESVFIFDLSKPRIHCNVLLTLIRAYDENPHIISFISWIYKNKLYDDDLNITLILKLCALFVINQEHWVYNFLLCHSFPTNTLNNDYINNSSKLYEILYFGDVFNAFNINKEQDITEAILILCARFQHLITEFNNSQKKYKLPNFRTYYYKP